MPVHYRLANRFNLSLRLLRGMSKDDIEKAVFWDTVTLDALNKWRKVHIPIFMVFAVLSLGHILSIFMFWGWK